MIILTIISSMFLYFSPYLYLACLYTPEISQFDIWIIYMYNLNKTISNTLIFLVTDRVLEGLEKISGEAYLPFLH